ncbi:MAG: DUF1015 domain-containing protein [Lachnospiraceae bacterium]
MAVFKAFSAIRPRADLVQQVAALPYDVMNRTEAKQMVEGNPYSFLHVDKAEIDLPDTTDPYDASVYAQAANTLQRMRREGIYLQDVTPCYYIYRLRMNGKEQVGIVGCASIDDYIHNRIKKHELTRADKEEDRIRHVDTCDANTGPIFLAYRSREDINQCKHNWMQEHPPVYDFTAEDGIQHTVWVVDDADTILTFRDAFSKLEDLYIADGHHRAASAVQVGLKRRAEHPEYTGSEEFNYFLAVAFPDSELEIFDYNRVVSDLHGRTQEEFLQELAEVMELDTVAAAYRPEEIHTFGMYMNGSWYKLTLKDGICDALDTVGCLDVSVLQTQVLAPILGITDPRTSDRIAFVGGIRGLAELERLVDGGKALAFSMYPTSMEELMNIADQGEIMPPKSTWFEPKLRSGIFIHSLR